MGRIPRHKTNQSCPHRRTHQSCYNSHEEHINPGCHGEHINPGLTGEHINPATMESESSCSTRERIILFHKRANHLVPVRTNHGRVSHPVVICCSSRNRKLSELPELNVCNMQDPCTRVSCRLQVVWESHRLDLSSGL